MEMSLIANCWLILEVIGNHFVVQSMEIKEELECIISFYGEKLLSFNETFKLMWLSFLPGHLNKEDHYIISGMLKF